MLSASSRTALNWHWYEHILEYFPRPKSKQVITTVGMYWPQSTVLPCTELPIKSARGSCKNQGVNVLAITLVKKTENSMEGILFSQCLNQNQLYCNQWHYPSVQHACTISSTMGPWSVIGVGRYYCTKNNKWLLIITLSERQTKAIFYLCSMSGRTIDSCDGTKLATSFFVQLVPTLYTQKPLWHPS